MKANRMLEMIKLNFIDRSKKNDNIITQKSGQTSHGILLPDMESSYKEDIGLKLFEGEQTTKTSHK